MTTEKGAVATLIAGVRESLSELAGETPEKKLAVVLSFAFFFSVLCSYYIIRPLRDEMGVTVGPDGLGTLFTLVFFVMLAAVPLFGWVTSRWPRRLVAPIVYAFFIANLVIFWSFLSRPGASTGLASTFFVWVSVFNLFIVSMFWIVMADIWTSADAKRLYGVIAAGGSAGALSGPLITQSVVKPLGAANLLLVSAAFLAVALACAVRLRRLIAGSGPARDDRPAGDGIVAGAVRVLRSPYLFQIALWVLVANLISTFFYFEQSRIVGAAIAGREDRVQLFSRMDFASNTLAALVQLFVTGALIRRIGVGWAIAALPISALAGLAALGLAPVLWVIVGVVVVERAIGFAITNPAARVLYTVVEPEDKYKAQSFIDTVVFRGGDAASGWVFNGLAKAAGLATGPVALLTIPFAIAWAWLSFRLGREQERLAAHQAAARPASATSAR